MVKRNPREICANEICNRYEEKPGCNAKKIFSQCCMKDQISDRSKLEKDVISYKVYKLRKKKKVILSELVTCYRKIHGDNFLEICFI